MIAVPIIMLLLVQIHIKSGLLHSLFTTSNDNYKTHDPAADLLGWDIFIQEFSPIYKKSLRSDENKNMFILSHQWQLCPQLFFWLPKDMQVFLVCAEKKVSQFSFLETHSTKRLTAHSQYYFITDSTWNKNPNTFIAAAKCKTIKQIPIQVKNSLLKKIYIFQCSGFGGIK